MLTMECRKVGSALCSNVFVFHRVFTLPCLSSSCIYSTVPFFALSVLHRVFTPPCLSSPYSAMSFLILCGWLGSKHHLTNFLRRVFTPSCLYSTMSFFTMSVLRRVFTSPCLYSTMSLLHHFFLFHRVFTPPCLYSTMSLFHHWQEGSTFRRVFGSPSLSSRVKVRVRHGGLGLGLDTVEHGHGELRSRWNIDMVN